MKNRAILAGAILISLICADHASAWNNAAQLRDSDKSASGVKTSASYIFGDGRRGFEAPRMWTSATEAYTQQYLPKLSVKGTLRFTQSMGYDTFANISDTPGRYPVDILEYTKGNKSKQLYYADASLAGDINKNWRWGVQADMNVSRTEKSAELSYTGRTLNFGVRPGLQWNRDGLSAGVGVLLSRDSEFIEARQTDRSRTIEAYLIKGLLYGVMDQWEKDTISLAGGLPAAEWKYGISGQIGIKGFAIDASYTRSSGRMGAADRFIFPGNSYEALFSYRFSPLSGYNATVSLNSSIKNQTLYELGSQIFHKSSYAANPVFSLVKAGMFEASASISYRLDTGLSTLNSDYTGVQSVRLISGEGSLNWHFNRAAALKTRIYAGNGYVRDELLPNNPEAQGGTKPLRRDKDYESWYEHLATPNAGINLSPEYRFANGIFLQAFFQGEYRKRSYRISGGLTLGYDF